MSFNTGTTAFNPAVPGPIGGTTPAAGTFTIVSVVDGDLNIRGVTSTGTGMSIGNGANTLRLVTPGGQWLAIGSNGIGNVTRTDGGPFMVAKSGIAMYCNAGGAIFEYFTDGATTHTDGTEDTLYTDTLPANGLSNNGEKLRGFYQVSIVGHAISTDRIRVYFGGTVIFDTGALNAATSGGLRIEFEIIRVSATVVRCSAFASTPIALLSALGSQYTEVTGLTLSSTQIIKLTALSTGTNSAAGDVIAKLGGIWWFPTSNITGA